MRIVGCTVWHLRDTVELAIGISVVPVLESDMRRAIPASHFVSFFNWHNKVLPAFSTTKDFGTIFCNAVVNRSRILENTPNEVDVVGQVTQAFERSDEVERDEALGVHVGSEEPILAKVVNGEVVLDLGLQHG